jgi:hypothetical protein
MHLFVTPLYAGPILGSLALNGFGALIAALCIYVYTNRRTFARHKYLYLITKPFHQFIKKLALSKAKRPKSSHLS